MSARPVPRVAGVSFIPLVLALPAIASAAPAANGARAPDDPTPTDVADDTAALSPTSFLSRFGLNDARRLLQSADSDTRLRGIDRAASSTSPHSLAVLLSAADAVTAHPSDPRLLGAVVQGLVEHLDQDPARAALEAVVEASAGSLSGATSTGETFPETMRREGLVRLAQQQAAMALASSGDPRVTDTLLHLLRQGSAAQAIAGPALETRLASTRAIVSSGPLEPATLALLAEIGDASARDALFAAATSSTAPLSAAALSSLAKAGDPRCVAVALSARRDPNRDVRLAAARALVLFHAPESDATVADLIATDVTAQDGLELARHVRGPSITRAAAARLAASEDADLRAAAVGALGEQTSAEAISALDAFATDPNLRGRVALSLARSPSAWATPALARLANAARDGASRRLWARAYLVRRYELHVRSAPLDALLGALARSEDARDRAVAIFAAVAFGESPIERSLLDPDARVRRAAAMAASAQPAERTLELMSRLAATETDQPTKVVLSIGLLANVANIGPSNEDLVARVEAGGADAPVAAWALGRRSNEDSAARAEPLLAATDPLIRAHFARGLAKSGALDGPLRVAAAYRWELVAGVRRAMVSALAEQPPEGEANAVVKTLRFASRFDPDPAVRGIARERGQRGQGEMSSASDTAAEKNVAWIALEPAPADKIPPDETGLVVDSSGLALPIAFDEDGYALLFVPPGDTELRLASRLSSYSADAP